MEHLVPASADLWVCTSAGLRHRAPRPVRGLALYGLLTGRQVEIDWLNEGQWRTFYPEVWRWYLDRTPAEHHDAQTGFHHRQVLGDDERASKVLRAGSPDWPQSGRRDDLRRPGN